MRATKTTTVCRDSDKLGNSPICRNCDKKLRQIGKIPNVSSRRRQGIYTTYIYIHAVAVAPLTSPAHHVATQRWVGFKGPNPHRVDDMTSDPTNLSLFRQNQKLRMSQ